ncbi:MAG: hypothetical protein U0167_13465 [bacterium]
MSRRRIAIAGVLIVLLLAVGVTLAVAPKSYQVTGPVVSVTDDMIVVQKGKEQWELSRDVNTKVTGELKVGEKVTAYYRMIATSVEVKAATPAKMEKAEPKKKTEPKPEEKAK